VSVSQASTPKRVPPVGRRSRAFQPRTTWSGHKAPKAHTGRREHSVRDQPPALLGMRTLETELAEQRMK
jgi:hypothetical protein